MITGTQAKNEPASRNRVVAFAARAFSVIVFTIGSFRVIIHIAFPRPSMADHVNNTIIRLTGYLTNSAFLVLLVVGFLLTWMGCGQKGCLTSRYWISVLVCVFFFLAHFR